MLRPPNDQTDTERQGGAGDQSPATAESQKEKTYHSVLRQIQQQQMLKHGRRFKKKTLIKMAKLYVISKGWDSETMEVTGSNRPSPEHERLVLNQEEDTLTPLVSSKSDTNSLKDEKKESVLLNVSTDATFSGETAAPVTLNKRPHTRIKPTKEDSGAAEMSTNLLDDSQESLLCSRPVKASRKKGKLKKITSVTLQEDTEITCDVIQLSSNSPSEISSAAAPKKQAFKTRTKTKSGVKKSTKEKLLPQTFTEYNDVMTLDVSESNEVDVNAAKQKHSQRKISELTSGNVCDKETTILSTISTVATLPGQTAAPVTLKKKKSSRTSKKKIEESREAETDASTNLLDKSQESLLYFSPVISKKRKIISVTLKEKISTVDEPKKQRKERTKSSKVGIKNSSLIQETVFNGMDLNAAKQEHDKSERNSLKDGKNSCDKESVLSNISTDATFSAAAVTLKKRKRPHEKTHWPVKPYSCSTCCYVFDKLQELERHSQMHSGASPFSCTKCEKAFSSFKLLRSHQVFEVCSEKQDAAYGNRCEINGFFVSQSAEGQTVTPVFFKCPICKQLHRHWCHYVLHLQTHTHSKSYTCETCRQQYDEAAGIRSHCTVCCRRSGEERACRSALTDIWKEPEAPENQVFEPHLDDQSLPLDEDKKVHMSALPQVKKVEKVFTGVSSSPASPGSVSLSVTNDFDISASSLSSGFCPESDRASQQPSGFHLQSLFRRHCGRYSCGHCGKSFSWWTKLWLHKRHHRQTSRASFSCSQCDLEFRFLGSYMDHQREHAAQTPYACPLCPDAFVSEEKLCTHVSECHKQRDNKKCSICGKNFSTLTNLKKHKMLHKGVNSHFRLRCNVSFSSNSALKTHLKTHKTRLSVPQPAGPAEPLLFPYHCRRCTATFSSTDLLQAHQVCHFIAGRKPESSPSESVASFIPSRATEDTQAGVSGSSQRKWRLPVSNKKHLFRYPHPDRLYVVPIISSEPPIVISDTEEERPSIATSASNTGSDFPQRQPGASSTISNLPQSSSVSTPGDTDGHETGSSENQLQDHSDKSSVLPGSHPGHDSCTGISGLSGCDSDLPEPVLLFIMENEVVDEVHSCAICMETFRDISKLHEHYVDHARGV